MEIEKSSKKLENPQFKAMHLKLWVVQEETRLQGFKQSEVALKEQLEKIQSL